MNAYQKLKRTHDDHRLLMRRIAKTSGGSEERERLFGLLARDVESRMAAEGRSQTRRRVAEHEPVRALLDELRQTDTSGPGWLETFAQFRDALEHRMREEEQAVLERSEARIDNGRADGSGLEFDGRKPAEQRRFDH